MIIALFVYFIGSIISTVIMITMDEAYPKSRKLHEDTGRYLFFVGIIGVLSWVGLILFIIFTLKDVYLPLKSKE